MRSTETLAERLRRRARVTDSGCWEWQGGKNNMGYGTITLSPGHTALVHRCYFEEVRGIIPAGLVLDHLCSNRACFNPDHLEPVTQRENTLRSPNTLGSINAAKTHCPQGHPYSPDNTYVYKRKSPRQCTTRICRTCAREQAARRAARKAVSA